MPRYVAKEDVEKGLVDPTKPLEEQLLYKQKIDKEIQEKEKQVQKKNVQQRPKKQRPPRNNRPQFNWNRNQITLQTKVPEKPKKLLEKPNSDKYREGLQKLKAEREQIKKQRQALGQQQKALLRDLTESKKNGREAISQYSGAMRDKFNLQNQLRKQIRMLDDHKKKINSEIQYFSFQLNQFKNPTSAENLSIQYLKSSIDSKEHQLTTAQISKRQQAKLNNQINELKRALAKARPYIQIATESKKLEDKINLLYRQVKPIKHELHIKITEANSIRAELDDLKEQRKTTQGQTKVQRTPEETKAQYDAKFKALDEKRQKLEERIDDYVDKFTREGDDYEDQQDLLKYIKWVEDQIAYLHKRKQQQERRNKEKQQRQKRKIKQREQYQKRQQERKKQQQQRKVREQARKKRLEEQREKYINRNPNYEIIDLCQSLIEYCQSLRPNQFPKYQDSRNKQPGEISLGKEWQKEIKGGAQVIQSKKSKLDEQAPKKQAKPKKKEQATQDEDFSHGIEIVNQFQSIKLLPPLNGSEIDSAIKLIKDKIAFYSNPTEEQKAAFRQKAAKQFDQKLQPRERRQAREGKQFKQKNNQQQGQHPIQKKVHHQKKEKKELNAGDFPGLA